LGVGAAGRRHRLGADGRVDLRGPGALNGHRHLSRAVRYQRDDKR
jgi:hypothetical protein